MYARSPSLSQRQAPTTIASRSAFLLGVTRIGSKTFIRVSTDKQGPKERNRNKLIESSHRNVKISNTDRNNLDRHTAGNVKPPDLELIYSIKHASDMSRFPLLPRGPLGPVMFPSC